MVGDGIFGGARCNMKFWLFVIGVYIIGVLALWGMIELSLKIRLWLFGV